MRFVSLALLCAGPALLAQYTQGTLEANLKELGCNTLLVAPKEPVVDPIHWSPDGKSIGIKLDGAWVRCDLDHLQLKRFKWRDNQVVAAPISRPTFLPLDDLTRKSWAAGSEEESRQVKTWSGIEVSLVPQPPKGVLLRVKPQGEPARVLWRTSQEDCQALSLSPDQRWVAFLCGIHGVAVMRLPEPLPMVQPKILKQIPAAKVPAPSPKSPD